MSINITGIFGTLVFLAVGAGILYAIIYFAVKHAIEDAAR